ncbi:MAG: ATP-binding cassette domain-containing protein [Candidatus Accumulibacter sp.]|jgi:ABC-type proline/glycine betaine transport system permease subunit/ABC-type proline/glycine betaine transport system ATPase subunit|nr:ATP-binding cassette domain-containing protein [Accumulibacter sp.]
MPFNPPVIIELRNLLKQYHGPDPVTAIADINLEIHEGEVFALMGASGSGKSTLLRHINGLIEPTSGSVVVDGQELKALSRRQLGALRSRRMGMVFQHFGLLPHRSALENVMLPLELRGYDSRSNRSRAAEQLALVGLGNALHRFPEELSGGMQQRVGLARALVGNPGILLMDEPFGALDPTIRRDLQDQLLDMVRSRRITTIIVTHDPAEALRMADRVALLRDGRIVQIGEGEDVVRHPADAGVANFFRGIEASVSKIPLPAVSRIPAAEIPHSTVAASHASPEVAEIPDRLARRLLLGPPRYAPSRPGLFWAGTLVEAGALAMAAAGAAAGSWPRTATFAAVFLAARLIPVRHNTAVARELVSALAVSWAIYVLILLRVFDTGHAIALLAPLKDKTLFSLVSAYLDKAIAWMQITFAAAFTGIVIAVRTVIESINICLTWLPWPVPVFVLLFAAWQFAGPSVFLLTVAALAYTLLFGLWAQTIVTVSLVGAAVLIAIVLGIPVGILAARSAFLRKSLSPLLDVMQTLPSFVYLIPAVAFFSVGKTPAVVATVIFAIPPMIRLTTLGIREVPSSTIEAAYAHGATPWQVLVKVELPLALPSLLLGINQTIVMSLSMVVIAALIGAGGLGYDVVTALRNIQGGAGFLAGLAIVFCALVPDRIIQKAMRKNRRYIKH